MSSETPPSIPPRKKPATDTGKSAPASGSVTSPGTAKSGTAGTATQAKASSASESSAGTRSTTSPSSSAGAAAKPSTTTTRTAASGTDTKPAGGSSSTTATAARPTGQPTTAVPTATPQPAARPAATSAPRQAAPAPRPAAEAGPRRVRVAISRLDPWSVMKLSFLISVAIAIMIVVAAAVLWLTLDGLQVFAQINDLAGTIFADSDFNVLEYVSFSRVLSAATLVAVIDIFLITALSTIGAFLYNITATLVGGVHVTMTDD